MAKIKAHPKTGLLINGKSVSAKDGKEYSTIRVDELRASVENGFLNSRNRTAFIRGLDSQWQALLDGLKDGDKFPIDGQIVVMESHTPFYAEQAPKINPETSEVIMVDGKAVYRQTKFTADMKAKDQLLFADDADAEADAIEALGAEDAGE
jgi:hypothetical protein